jgi:hypothetical protein
MKPCISHDGSECISDGICGMYSPFPTMGVMKKVGPHSTLKTKRWRSPNLVCNIEEKIFDAKWKYMIRRVKNQALAFGPMQDFKHA